jgi:hypothetical protein
MTYEKKTTFEIHDLEPKIIMVSSGAETVHAYHPLDAKSVDIIVTIIEHVESKEKNLIV